MFQRRTHMTALDRRHFATCSALLVREGRSLDAFRLTAWRCLQRGFCHKEFGLQERSLEVCVPLVVCRAFLPLDVARTPNNICHSASRLILADDIHRETILAVSEIRAADGASSCADLHHSFFFYATADEPDEALVRDIE